MARKDLLKGLMGGDPTPREDAPPLPRYARGAIGAVSRSIADLKSRSLTEIPAEAIDDAGIRDRLDEDRAGIETLKASILEYGQQVPVLLRQNPADDSRYEIVFGRRRVQALRELGQPVKAMIRDLSDRELVIAQGQENTARKDLSFIEKANFAAQMVRGGYERKVICDALSIDKTVISRMLTVTDAVAPAVIRAIGSAPAAGRDRWLMLAKLAEGRDPDELIAAATGARSDARFEAVLAAIQAPKPAAIAPRPLAGANGAALGQARKAKEINDALFDAYAKDKRLISLLTEKEEELHQKQILDRLFFADMRDELRKQQMQIEDSKIACQIQLEQKE